MIEGFNSLFQNNFYQTVYDLLNSQYTSSHLDFSLNSIEEDLIITYGFRNLGAHRIEDQPIIEKYFQEILNRVLNVFLFTIEKLY